MLACIASHTINPLIMRKVPYDLYRDFAPVTLAMVVPNILVSNPSLPHVRAGKLRAYGVTMGTRPPAAPDIPTIAEGGLPGYEAAQWFGLLVPAGTPSAIVAKLHEAVGRAVAAPSATPEAFRQFMQAGNEQVVQGDQGCGHAAGINQPAERERCRLL